MKEFKSLKSFARHLEKCIAKFPEYEKKTALFFGEILEKEAKDKIGHLQAAAGPFSEWAELAESTKRDKERLGYVYNSEYNPEYRTGELKDSIHFAYFAALREIVLGSDSEIMVYQELGTKYIPPRSMIGATMFQAAMLVNIYFSEMMKAWILGKPLTLRKMHLGSI
ncbi:MAG: hypothetical protein ACHP9Y_03055 [Gammaproteobacteria bacterium]